MSTNTLDRLSFIDILKIGATFAIVLLHVSALYVRMDAQLLNPSGTLPYIINSLTRVALPLFMMATGTLLLRDRYRFNLKNKFTFIAKTYIFWSALYICADQVLRLYVGDDLLSPAEMIVGWIRGPYHFWYLQMLLGFYLLMPLLARLKGLQTLSYAMLLLFVITYIYNPLAPHLPVCVQTFIGQIILTTPSAMLFYFLLGAWLYRVPHRRKLAIGSAISILVGIGIRLYQLFSTPTYQDSSLFQPLNSYSELLIAAGVYYLLAYLFRNYQAGKKIQYLSKCTLRIYVVSALVIYGYQVFIQPSWDSLVPWPTLSIVLWSIVVFLCSWLIAHVLMRKDRALQARRTKRTSR